jgi:hypothetical protein
MPPGTKPWEIPGATTSAGTPILPPGNYPGRAIPPSARDNVQDNQQIQELMERARAGDAAALEQLRNLVPGGSPIRPGQINQSPLPGSPSFQTDRRSLL